LTLEDDTELVYKCDDFYHPTSENWILRNDTSLHIDWENYYTQALTISEKDKKNLTFDTFTSINPF
jgi:dTDP-4-dehydrorhamnose 3,5-epimerase